MKIRFLLLATLGLLTVHSSLAEKAAPPDPQLAAMPARLAFNKSYQYPPVSLGPDATEAQKKRAAFEAQFFQVVQKMDFTKDGETQREILSFTNGKKKEVWKSGEFTFVLDPSGMIMVLSASMVNDEGVIKSLTVPAFDEVKWVDKTNFQGEEEHLGVKCFAYKSGNMTAWIDQATRLPAFFESPKMQVAYSYQAPEALTLPDKFVKQLEKTKRGWAGIR